MSRLGTMVGAMLVASAMSMPAQAVDGRITFSGAVVTPTCRPELRTGSAPQHTRSRCPDTSAATRYTLSVEPASQALQGSQLITYFDSYLRANGTSAWLATQQYD